MSTSELPSHEHAGRQRTCPLCMLIDAVERANPEAASHLRAAGQELSEALRAVVEQMSFDEPGPGDQATAADTEPDWPMGRDPDRQA